MSNVRELVLTTGAGEEIHGVFHLPDLPGPRPTVVVCHGFKGFLEWGFFPPLADLLVARGFTVVRFNFRGSGMRPGDALVTERAAFRGATLSGDRDDLLRVLAALDDEIAPGRVDVERIGIVGHSRGGGSAALVAGHPEWRDRLGALVTWAAVDSFDRFDARAKAAWRRDGEIPIVNARTGQELPIGIEVLEELEEMGDELSPRSAASRVQAPWLIVHGDADETVALAEGEALHAAATAGEGRRPCELLRIAGGGHTFGATHPFSGPTPHLVEVLNATQTWLRRHLG